MIYLRKHVAKGVAARLLALGYKVTARPTKDSDCGQGCCFFHEKIIILEGILETLWEMETTASRRLVRRLAVEMGLIKPQNSEDRKWLKQGVVL